MTSRIGLLAATVGLALALPASASAATDLSAFWHLDESAGTIANDDSANGNHGTLEGGAAHVTGRFTRALSFDGVDDAVRIANSASLEPANVTVEGWVRAGASPGAFKHIISKSAYLCEVSSYALYTGPGGGLGFYVSNGSDDLLTISPFADAAVWDGAWHHVAGTFDGTTVRLYVDGAEVGTGSTATHPIGYGLPNVDGLLGTFGGSCASPLAYAGDLDEPRIWQRALSAVEIAASKAMGGAATTRLDQETDSTQSVAFTSRFTGQSIVVSTESATGNEQISSIRLVALLPLLSRVTCRGGLLSLLNSNCTYTLSNGGRTASLTVRPLLGRPVATLRVGLASGRSFDVEVDTDT